MLVSHQFRIRLTFLALNLYSFTVYSWRIFFLCHGYSACTLSFTDDSLITPCICYTFCYFHLFFAKSFTISDFLLIFDCLQLISHLLYLFCQLLLPPFICLSFIITVYLFWFSTVQLHSIKYSCCKISPHTKINNKLAGSHPYFIIFGTEKCSF